MNPNNIVMVFDVETTGLIPKRPQSTTLETIKSCPYILQLCFVLYDMDKQEIIRKFNSYVDVDDSVEISPKITEITGIVRETCKSRGIPIQDVLTEFYRAYQSCDVIVAHNIDFDKEMIMIEVMRNYQKMYSNGCENPSILFNEIHNVVYSKHLYCTMRYGKDLCDLWVECKTDSKSVIKTDGTTEEPNKRRYKKNPKLSELHFKIFNEIPDGLHDALVDTLACLKCYIHLMSIAKN